MRLVNANPYYDTQSMLRMGVWMALLFALCHFTGGAAFAVMIPVTLAAVVGHKSTRLFYLLLLATAAMCINGFFMPKRTIMSVAQKCVMLGAAGMLALQVFGRKTPRHLMPLRLLFPYLIFMAVSSQFGWCPVISDLKLFLFTLTFLAFYGCSVEVMGLRSDERALRSGVLVLCVFFILGSLAVTPFPGISYMASEEEIRMIRMGLDPSVSLYKGVTAHSQALGPIMAMLAVFLLTDLTFRIQRPDRLYLLMLLAVPLLVYRTSSRTAMGSLIAGVGFVTWLAMGVKGGHGGWRQKVVGTMIALAIAGGMAVVAIPAMRQKAEKFIVKSYSGEVVMQRETILGSRQGLLDRTLANWKRSPLIGNGFQVSEQMAGFEVKSFRDILTAPVEKSTWIYAILEEGGIIGMGLFLIFLFGAIGMMIRRKAYIGASLLFTFSVINLGEFGMFAMSMEGGFFWGLVFAGLVFDAKRVEIDVRNRLFERVKSGFAR